MMQQDRPLQVFVGKTAIDWYRLVVLRSAVKLEIAGLRHSSGRSMTQSARTILGLRKSANREQVLAALEEKIEEGRRAAAQ